MIQILVKLSVRDFAALERFETLASAVMTSYGGCFVAAFEVERSSDGGGTEVHVLQFPSAAIFEQYRDDPRLHGLSALRAQAISATEVTVSRQIKSYRTQVGGA